MTTLNIIYLGFGAIFSVTFLVTAYHGFRKTRRSGPMTKADLLRRSGMRIGFCALPYLVLAWLLRTFDGNDALFNGFCFWTAVVVVPVLGLVLDLALLSAGETK